MQHVVIGIILNADQQVLVAQRLAHQIKAGFWEFPGGKVEPNETALQALQRELQEELGIDVTEAEEWLKFDYRYPHKHVLLDIWIVKAFQGIARGAEGQPIRWISTLEFQQLQFPEGNRLIIEKLVEILK